jgi:predicted phage terminase large subunit-like protein
MADAAWVGDPPIRLTKYVRQSPEIPQHAFLLIDWIRDALYGGAAGGGKSSALLAAALQYVDVPGYSALLLRRTFRDLNQPDALIPRSLDWLANTDAKWNDNDHRWTFPSGATLTFGYLAHENDKLQYQGAAFQFVGFDELTQFTETQFTYLFSRCRRPKLKPDASKEQHEKLERLSKVPLRVRSASNPGGPGHEWVKARYGLYHNEGEDKGLPYVGQREDWVSEIMPNGKSRSRIFIPAKLSDNSHLDADSYRENLSELDHHTRKQLETGDWDSAPPGDLFRKEWFEANIVDTIPEGCKWVRFWDLAATEKSESNPDPDWTVGLRMGKHPNGTYYIEDVHRLRARPAGVTKARREMADRDGKPTHIHLEQEPGSAGVTVVNDWITGLADRVVSGERSTGSKWDRASVVSSKAEHGLVKLKRATWNTSFIAECEAFTQTDDHAHDDQVDAMSGAYAVLTDGASSVTTQSYRPSHGPTRTQVGDLVLEGDHHIDK